MNDVDDMPELLKRAEEAGKKLGEVLRRARHICLRINLS